MSSSDFIIYQSREIPGGAKSEADSADEDPRGHLAGLGAGATEAVAVVTPMEVIKIRLQAQQRESTDLTCRPPHPHFTATEGRYVQGKQGL